VIQFPGHSPSRGFNALIRYTRVSPSGGLGLQVDGIWLAHILAPSLKVLALYRTSGSTFFEAGLGLFVGTLSNAGFGYAAGLGMGHKITGKFFVNLVAMWNMTDGPWRPQILPLLGWTY